MDWYSNYTDKKSERWGLPDDQLRAAIRDAKKVRLPSWHVESLLCRHHAGDRQATKRLMESHHYLIWRTYRRIKKRRPEMLETIGLTFGWSIVGRPEEMNDEGKVMVKLIVDLPSRIRTADQLKGYILSRLIYTRKEYIRQEAKEREVMQGRRQVRSIQVRNQAGRWRKRQDPMDDPGTPIDDGRVVGVRKQVMPADPMIRAEDQAAAERAAEYDHEAMARDAASFGPFAETDGERLYVGWLVRVAAGGADAETAWRLIRDRWPDRQIEVMHGRLGERVKRAATRPEPEPVATGRAAGLPV